MELKNEERVDECREGRGVKMRSEVRVLIFKC